MIHFYYSRQFSINNIFFPLLEKPPKARGICLQSEGKRRDYVLQKSVHWMNVFFCDPFFIVPDNFLSTIIFFPCLKNLRKRGVSVCKRRKAKGICLQKASLDERIFVIHFYCSRQFSINNNFFPLLEKISQSEGYLFTSEGKRRDYVYKKRHWMKRIFVIHFYYSRQFSINNIFFPLLEKPPKARGICLQAKESEGTYVYKKRHWMSVFL